MIKYLLVLGLLFPTLLVAQTRTVVTDSSGRIAAPANFLFINATNITNGGIKMQPAANNSVVLYNNYLGHQYNVFWDDFNRSNATGLLMGKSDSGHDWNVVNDGLDLTNGFHIYNGVLQDTNTISHQMVARIYMTNNFDIANTWTGPSRIRRIGAMVRQYPGGGGGGAGNQVFRKQKSEN